MLHNLLDSFYNTSLTLVFFSLAFLLLFIGFKGYKSNNKYGASSTIICSFFLISFGYFNSILNLLPLPYNGFLIWWICIISTIFIGFGLYIRMIKRRIIMGKIEDESSKIIQYIKKLAEKENSSYQDKISIKMEVIRKSFHLTGILIILAYFGFFFIPPLTQLANGFVLDFINNFELGYEILWGDVQWYPYSYGDFQATIDLTFFALIAAYTFMIIPDLIRILWGPEYSLFHFLTRAVLRKKEYNAVGPQIYLVTGVIFSYILYMIGVIHILSFLAGILIACFSDALAALIGRTFGTHKVKCLGNQVKTIEGFLAGITSAYLIGFLTVGPLYAIFGALIFFLLDYFPTLIADNILNPIIITLVITLCYIFLPFPIGLF
jgi:dolichol kinase